MTLFTEILRRLELKKESLATSFWNGIVTGAEKVLMGTGAESPRRVEEVSRLLDKIECALKSRLPFRQKSRSSFRNSIFRPASRASRIFVKNAGPIMAQLSNNDASIKDVSRQYGVNEKSLKESMHYYLFR